MKVLQNIRIMMLELFIKARGNIVLLMNYKF